MSGSGGGGAQPASGRETCRVVDFVREDGVAGPIAGLFSDTHNPRVGLALAIDRMAGHLETDLASWVYISNVVVERNQALIDATPGMRPDHVRAIYLYTAACPLYTKLNAALRSSDRELLSTVFFPYLRLILEALGLLPRAPKQEVFRGVNRNLVAECVPAFRVQAAIAVLEVPCAGSCSPSAKFRSFLAKARLRHALR